MHPHNRPSVLVLGALLLTVGSTTLASAGPVDFPSTLDVEGPTLDEDDLNAQSPKSPLVSRECAVWQSAMDTYLAELLDHASHAKTKNDVSRIGDAENAAWDLANAIVAVRSVCPPVSFEAECTTIETLREDIANDCGKTLIRDAAGGGGLPGVPGRDGGALPRVQSASCQLSIALDDAFTEALTGMRCE